ncbi:TolC family protein [Muricoccus radiodurans]|uniref:TolC family protein n=1 Tax=Muricoccus radiodurans TaxID=2231721 RepID=UPI003CF69FC1
MRLHHLVFLLTLVAARVAAADLREGFAAALALNADLRGLEAQRGVVDARRGGANAFLPGAPAVSGSWRTTTFTQRRGYQEFEVGAEVPIWLPGEARALRGTAEAQGVQLEARVRQARLTLAGEVRDAYWTWSASVAERDAATARVNAARALERDLARQVGAGNAPRADLLLATADLREAEGALRSANGAIRDAALAFRTLTGSDPTPGRPETPAPAPTGDAALANLPAAAVARASAELARAEQRLARIRDRANPTIFGGWRREREESGADWLDRPVIGIRIPFGYEPLRNERVATARAEATAAEATLATVARTLANADRRARAQAEDAAALASLAEARHRALAEQVGLSEAAYRAGNLAFAEVVRVRGQLAAADAARRRAQVEGGRAASQINQILGLEPR